MTETFDIAGYCRISVDEDQDRDNVSIENQKTIIQDFVQRRFPGSTLTFFEDRDRSGYTFEQREDYQTMRRGLMSHQYDILVVKDFSRFSRRNSRGLVELEDLRDAGVRIISIGDNIDFPNDDDWLKIQFQFLINEMPVTDTSKKVRNVIKRRQADGKWICAAPYGYIVNKRQEFEIVPTEADVVRTIFRLYNDEGWGYKKIANYLTDQGIPTPRMAERNRKEAAGEDYKRPVKSVWAIVTVQGILDNDFYIGTLRQGKYTRKKINGKDILQDEDEQVVIENHHQAIIDYRTFATTRALREKRTTSHYRGVKKYDNMYSGFLVCGDCDAPMFAMSRKDLKSAYTCGTYHRRGRSGCTSHHIRADKLDELLKCYVKQVMDHSAAMLTRLNEDLAREQEDVHETEQSADRLAEVLSDLQEELKVTKRQRIRDLMKHPEQEELLEQTYDELESDLQKRIEGIGHQIEMLSDQRNTIIRVNRAARTAMDVFRDILNKDRLDRRDLELVIQKIRVFEDHLEIQLQADVDSILRSGTLPEETEGAGAMTPAEENTVNFRSGMGHIAPVTIVQEAKQHPDKVFHANVIDDGEALVGITKKNIRFYEAEGLLTPRRNSENGYREYSEAEVGVLRRIKLMRKLGLPLEEIRQMQSGSRTVGDSMRRHLITLERDQRNLEQSIQLCASLADCQERLAELDAESLLAEMEHLERSGTTFQNKQRQDTRIRYVAPVVITVLTILLMGGLAGLIVWGYTIDVEEAPPLPLVLVLAAMPVVIIGGVVLALMQRIREIEKGEEDDARQF